MVILSLIIFDNHIDKASSRGKEIKREARKEETEGGRERKLEKEREEEAERGKIKRR
jgi:hypothetical protein